MPIVTLVIIYLILQFGDKQRLQESGFRAEACIFLVCNTPGVKSEFDFFQKT
jgi:hypothetical protein